MTEFSVDICCPECSSFINVKLTELRMGGSTICPKCGAKVKFSVTDLCEVQEEAKRIERIVRKIGT